MGQYWKLLNFDKWEKAPRGGAKLGQWLFDRRNDGMLVSLLAVPLEFDEICKDRVSDLLDRPYMLTPELQRELGQLALPAEILLYIYEMIEHISTAAALGLTNSRLLQVGLRHIHMLLVKRQAPWAGDRIMCVGDYQEDADLPDDFLTAKEAKELRLIRPPTVPKMRLHEAGWILGLRESPDSYAFVLNPNETGKRQPQNIQGFAGDNFLELPLYFSSTRLTGDTIRRHLDGDEQRLYELLTFGYMSRRGEKRNWVLCNLTKHELVRLDAILEFFEESSADGPFTDGPIGLGHVLLTLICWSSDPSIAIPYDGDLHRGRWAGNRFEITQDDRMCPGEWTDISDEAVERAADIWRAEGMLKAVDEASDRSISVGAE